MLLVVAVQSTGLLERVQQQFAKTNERFVTKVPRIFQKPGATDVLIIGSSLIQVPAVRCDDDMRDGKTRFDPAYYDHIFQYEKAEYLRSLLSKHFGHDISCLNGAVAATNIADQYLLFKNYIENGGTCKTALLCISPRELHDNYHSVPEKTQVFDVLGNVFSPEALRERGLEGCLSVEWQRLNPLFAKRLQLQRAAASISSNTATSVSTPDFKQPHNMLRDMKMWHDTYNPVNWKLYATERSYLEKFMQLAREKDVPLMVVDMPLPRPTLAVIPPDLLSKYNSDLQLLSTKYGAQLIEPANEERYRVQDFEDGGHMVVSGGQKLFNSIGNHMANNNRVAAALRQLPAIAGRSTSLK